MVGVGSQYGGTYVDSQGRPLDGSKNYRLHLPPGIPAKDFWWLVLYDTQTRSELQTDQQFPSLRSQKAGLAVNADKSVDVYFESTAPPGKESNSSRPAAVSPVNESQGTILFPLRRAGSRQ
jgi:hypothetical protein